ncbi:hypothetical protein I9W82_001966 [Candida metapsilosis]|uniref:LYC1 C-terminal domain-containing protein n=1 Tax=Candida metapsilosis TaxID=273372 RepID=A0A8H7ZHH9_9ASCO|nr:hypothetical protein I9W82_001966 [Candida metapsilosis]
MSPTKITTTDQFKLIHLTDQEIIDFTRYQNSLAWKGPLTEKDYVLRDNVLSKSKVASSGNNGLYVFMMKSAYDDEPLCSIEMLVRESLKFEYTKDGQVKETNILSGCIGGVFTPPKQRGKGYARIMVDKLVQLAKRDIVGPDGFMFLYSEIGEYYAKNGFKSFPVDLINIPRKGISQIELPKSTIDYELIEYHQFKQLMDEYRSHFEQDMKTKVNEDHKTRVSINPTSDVIDWFHLRAKFITYKLFHEQKGHFVDFESGYETIKDGLIHEPKIFGLKLKSGDKVTGFIIWTIDWEIESGKEEEKEEQETNYATILKCVAFDNDEETRDKIAIELINLAIYQFIHHPVLGKPTTNVKLWESEITPSVKQHLVGKWGAEVGENSSRSAILMNDPVDDEKLRNGELIWEENTKLPWF